MNDSFIKRCKCGSLLRKATLVEKVKCDGCGEEWATVEGYHEPGVEPAVKP